MTLSLGVGVGVLNRIGPVLLLVVVCQPGGPLGYPPTLAPKSLGGYAHPPPLRADKAAQTSPKWQDPKLTQRNQ